jgi:hypothetical protein
MQSAQEPPDATPIETAKTEDRTGKFMSEQDKTHTPLPWTTAPNPCEDLGSSDGPRIESEYEHGIVNDGWIIATTNGPDAKANAKFIVEACNSHEALTAENVSLKAALKTFEWSGCRSVVDSVKTFCPICKNVPPDHAPDCKLAAALKPSLSSQP